MDKVQRNIIRQYLIVSIECLFRYGLINSIGISFRFLLTRLQFQLRLVRTKFIPPNFYLMMTKRCNLTCDFCHYVGELDRPSERSSNLEFTLDDFKRYEREGVISSPAKVCLYGGEPMLNDSFFEILGYINKRGYLSSTITNGSYLKKYLNALLEEPLYQMTMSYYPGVAERFEDELKRISKVTLINISYIIAKDDYRTLEDVVKFAIKCGARFITIENIIEKETCERKSIFSNEHYHGFKTEILKKYSSEIIFRWSDVKSGDESKKIQCSEPWDMVLLDRHNRVLPCCQYPLSEFKESVCSSKEFFNNPEIMELRSKMKSNEVPSKCEGCHYLYAKDPLYSFR